MLYASGWGPECAVAETLNTTRVLPPIGKRDAQIIIGGFDAMDWLETPDYGITNNIPLPDTSNTWNVEVATFFEEGYAFSCSVFDAHSIEGKFIHTWHALESLKGFF